MSNRKSKNALAHFHSSDLHAVARLATQATLAVTDMAEGVHQAVQRSVGAADGAAAGRTSGLTGLIYSSVRGVSRWVGEGVLEALRRLEPMLARLQGQGDESPERAAVLAALNGVMGDRLQASANPLATPMTLRLNGRVVCSQAPPVAGPSTARPLSVAPVAPIDAGVVSGRVLIVVHGLCMNDLQWHGEHGGKPVNHAQAIAQALGYTPVYLRYNSGLHVSQNGRLLAQQLDDLIKTWPVPVSCVSVLAHSMGGLVARSALQLATHDGLSWPAQLKHLLFLGTPHHGAPLERAGNWVDVLLGSTPYSRPFAKLGQLRSAGVTDLRYGHVQDSDWQGHDRFRRKPDSRTPLPLPDGVACFAIAATLAAKRSRVADRLVGDGLVPLPSALGQHPDAQRQLHFAPGHQRVVYRTSHMQLLSDPAITKQLIQWLTL